MKVAVIGGGVAGLVAARALASRAELALFEALDHLGGDAYTIDVAHRGQSHPVETGFVVYADRSYPRFHALLRELGVATQPAQMSFSIRDEAGLEIGTHAVRAMPLRYLLERDPYRILYDALRFRRNARRHLGNPELTLGEFLELGGYSRAFTDYMLLPPCAAGWCSGFDTVRAFPFVRWYRFFQHHVPNIRDLPTWRVVRGGASRYVEPLAAPFAHAVRLRTPVTRVERRDGGGVWVVPAMGEPERFDQVIVATHADQALALLAEPSEREQRVLGAFHYSDNAMCVHHDPAVLPRNRRLWSSWNYTLEKPYGTLPRLTYLMNVLFRFESETPFCLSVNRDDVIDPALVVTRFRATHPRFDHAAFAAQAELPVVSGADRIHYCGAYFGFGIHEDSVVSGEAAARAVLGHQAANP